jgi:hypothetical protein
MASTELAVSAQPSMTSLLVQKAGEAKMILSQPTTSASSALKAAKQLVGSFPHARPPEPETYAAAIGATLAAYPPAVVNECVDPRIGLARKREFPPTVASVVEWCDARLSYYQALARYEAREVKPEREFSDADRALAKRFLADLAAELRARNPGSPVASMLVQPQREAAE